MRENPAPVDENVGRRRYGAISGAENACESIPNKPETPAQEEKMKSLLQVLACGTVFLSGVAHAQAGNTIPRTADVKPDFQGVWTNSSRTRLERVLEYKDLVLTPEQAKG